VPTILLIYGMRFFFYSKEEIRMHIHVEHQGRDAKIWLDTLDVAYNRGFPDHELLKIIKIVRIYEKAFKKAWISHFG
jgi:hypothetical protein